MAGKKLLSRNESNVIPLYPNKKYLGEKKKLSGTFAFPVFIFISCFILYANTLHNGYALDDGIYTNKNDFIIKGFSAFKDIFDKGSLYGFDKTPDTQYRPLTLLSFMAETSIFGLNPHVSHFINVLFYAFTIVLLYFFLQKILKNYNRSIIVAATLLFAFHPIHTEVVANIKSRDEILGFLFGLSSFYFIILHYEQNKVNYYFFSLIAFLAAIFSKENCLTFVFIIPLLLYFFTSLEVKKIAIKTVPYFVLVAFYLIIRNIVLKQLTFSHQIPVMDNALMSAGNGADRIATSFVLMGKYIYMTIVPYPLSWDYSYNQVPIVSLGNIKFLLSFLFCLALVGYMLLVFRKKIIFAFLIALFFISLLLSSNLIVQIASTFGERFLYVPSVSFCIALPVILSGIWKRKINFYAPVICLLIIYTLIVIPRNNDWKNNYNLFSAGVITSPNSARTHLSLAQECGEELKQLPSNEEQQRLYNLDVGESYRALSIYNKYPEAYYNLGELYISSGLKDSALLMFQKAVSIKPDYAQAANNLGVLYAQKSNYNEAIKWFGIALKSDSTLPGLLLNIGSLYQKAGDVDRAAYYYAIGLKINPEDADIKNNLFILYYNSGKDYFNKNQYPQALNAFIEADRYNSQSTEVTGYLGALYQSGGNFAKAEEYYRKSLAINPTNSSVQRNLQMVIELQKDPAL